MDFGKSETVFDEIADGRFVVLAEVRGMVFMATRETNRRKKSHERDD